MTEQQAKGPKTSSVYELLYHPSIPGRGEYIRMLFEATGEPYIDKANSEENAFANIMTLCSPDYHGDSAGNPPHFAPPMLRVLGAGRNGKDLVISQTPNILLYLGPKLGLVGSDEQDLYTVNELALTALDLCNETHDTHHPIGGMMYYEDQKDAALQRAKQFRSDRIPKYFNHFERVLKSNKNGNGKFLVGSKLTYADTTLWHTIDGLLFAFPKEIGARQKDYPLLFDEFYAVLKSEPWLAEYLESDRRRPYSMGIYRRYPELDRQ